MTCSFGGLYPRAWIPACQRWFVVALAWLLLGSGGALGAERSAGAKDPELAARIREVRVRLTIHPQEGSARAAQLEGRATYELEQPTATATSLVLLNFAESIVREPTHLDEVQAAGYLSGPFSRGSLDVESTLGVERIERIGESRHLSVFLPAGTRSFELRYRVRVPRRYWPFGCIWGRCSVSGALAPLPSEPAIGGSWLPSDDRVVSPVRWVVEAADFVHRRKPMRDVEIVWVGPIRGERATPYPSLFFGPTWHRTREMHHGVTIEVLHPLRRPADRVPFDRKGQLYPDVVGWSLRLARESIALVERWGQPPAIGEHLTVVHGPLRSQIAQFHPDTVIVSDQAFELMPAHKFQQFHETEVARAILDVLAFRTFGGTHDPSTDLWLSGAYGFALVRAWAQRDRASDEFASDLLRNFTFVPAVDRFLYTGQANFAQAYFRSAEDDLPLRNHPLLFANALPTGRRIHEKLLDTLGSHRLAGFYRAMLEHPTRDPRRAAEIAYGFTLDWFFAQWLGPHPQVDYAIVGIESTAESDGFRHTIMVEKLSKQPIIEPIQVLVTERSGKQHFLTWNGQLGAGTELRDEPLRGRHVLKLHTTERLRSVRLDPRNRTLQTPLIETHVDPQFNDRVPAAPRFLYTGFGLTIAASEFVSATTALARLNALSGFAYFEGSKRRDVKVTHNFQIFRDRENHVGVGVASSRWFGAMNNRQRRRGRVRFGATFNWLKSGSLDPRGGLRWIESVMFSHETRRFLWWPNRGHRWSLGLGARQTVHLGEGPAAPIFDAFAGAQWARLWPIANQHVLASQLSFDIVLPIRGAPEFRSLVRPGGIGSLAAYGGDEIFGRASANVQLEYRHVYVNNLKLNLVHLAWLRTLGGVLFGGVATTSECDGYGGLFARDRWHAQLGYGLTAHLQLFGVVPQLIRLDIAVPLVRRESVCLDRVLPDYLAEVQGIDDAQRLLPPFAINLTFNHPF